MTSPSTINVLLPEIALAVAAIVIYVAGAFFDARGGWRWIGTLALAVAGLALVWQWQHWHAGHPATHTLLPGATRAEAYGPVTLDMFGYLTCWFALGVGLHLVLLADLPGRVGPSSEWVASLLLVVAGVMTSAVANDLVLIFLALELISIPTYLLLVLSRPDVAGREATVKYFFLSVVSSGMLLYGFSFLYGATGSTEVARLAAPNLASGGTATLIQLGLLLGLAGLGMKIALVPFHFYAPDVYQGTSPAGAALLATVPKVAGMVVVLRLASAAQLELGQFSWCVLLCLAILTMTLGNVMALWQKSVRRLMGYSSVAHAGYLLIGLSVWLALPAQKPAAAGSGSSELAVDAISATLFYLVAYSLATLGAFAALGYLANQQRSLNRISDLDGLARSHPGAAAALAICMLSLTGLPPMVGFWGKLLLIFRALAIQSPTAGENLHVWFIVLAVATVINAAISAAYYLRLVSAMYFRPAAESVPAMRPAGGAALATGLAVLIVLGAGIYPAPLKHYSDAAAKSAVTPPAANPTPRDANVAGK